MRLVRNPALQLTVLALSSMALPWACFLGRLLPLGRLRVRALERAGGTGVEPIPIASRVGLVRERYPESRRPQGPPTTEEPRRRAG